jgi:hypothetical protein
MSSHFLHNEVSPLKFRCNILISGKIIKEMPGLVASGTHWISHHPSITVCITETNDQNG